MKQNTRWFPNSLLTAVVVFWAMLTAQAVPPLEGKTGPIDVLFIGDYAPGIGVPCWPKYQAACAKEGVRVFGNEKGLSYDQLTSDFLRQFQVVVFSGLPDKNQNATPDEKKTMASFRERLDAYHKAGGGIVWVPITYMHQATYWNQVVGGRYDVQSLEEALYDPARTLHVHSFYRQNLYDYVWTTNITKHPVTEGVQGLLLPLIGDWSWPGTAPMKFGKSWTVVINGMDSTRTIGNADPVGSGKHNFKPEVKGSYESTPQIVGLREGNGTAGRMMVLPFHCTHTWLNFGQKNVFNDAMMLNGYGGQPSDGFRLILNGLKWLAEPAVAAGGFGGYQPLPPITAAIPEPLDWSKAGFASNSWGGARTFWNAKKQRDTEMTDLLTPNGKDFKGILGARTAASDGHGSVADHVRAAKALGLSFVVFLEKLDKLDETKYAQFVADCAAASDETFAAVPGYLFRDQTGLLYYIFGTGITRLPLPENLTNDRRVRVPSHLYFQFGHETSLGLAELGKMKIDPNCLWHLSCTAPYEYEDAALVDDGLENYLSLEGHGHQYTPTALVQTTSPAGIMAAISGGAKLTVLHAETLAVGLKALTREHAQHPTPAYITNGPVIARWGALNPIGHPFFAGKQRVRFSLEATSDTGIAEVKIIDACTGRLFRHFKPDGAKNFTCSIDETHQRQWSLVPIVIDINGRSALAGTIQTFQDGNRFWMMGERFYGMHKALRWDTTRQRLLDGVGWGPILPWGKTFGSNRAGAWPGGAREGESRAIAGIDGASLFRGGSGIEPTVTTDLGTEPIVPAFRFQPRLASFDLAIMDYDGSAQFAVDKRKEFKLNGFSPNPDPQILMETADIQARTIAVRPREAADISANIHEITVVFKKDVTLKRINLGWYKLYAPVPVYLALNEGEGDLSWLIDTTEKFSRIGSIPTRGYLQTAKLGGAVTGLINLGSQPIGYSVNNYGDATFFINGSNRPVKAGEKIRVRFIAFDGAYDLPNSNQWLKKFIADFGIGADKPTYPFTVRQGRLRATDYMMELKPENGGATVEFGKYNLPHNLLVAVDGFAGNAVTGRYDLERKQLLILPVFEGKATTSVNTTLGDTKLYVGELFHCDNPDVRLSTVQDGVDKLLVEIHNPTAKKAKVMLTSVPGFTPLTDFKKTFEVGAFSSVKQEIKVTAGTLLYTPYEGD